MLKVHFVRVPFLGQSAFLFLQCRAMAACNYIPQKMLKNVIKIV